MKIILYATNKEGYVSKVGEYDTLEEISIRVAMFAKDVVLSLEQE